MTTRTASVVERWIAANPHSRALHEQARTVLPSGVTHDVRRPDPFPPTIVRAQGARKWDADGHELVCYVMGHGSLLFGHGHEPVVEAVRRQAELGLHYGASHELERAWAAQIVSLLPAADRVRFTSSGTEATMLALQVARAATGRARLIKLEGHFHGWHDYAAFGVDPPYERPATPAIPDGVASTVTVVPPDLDIVDRELAAGDVAAVMLEPAGAAWGTVSLPAGFVAALRERTRAAGALLVFDEVVTGFRWSPGGAQALLGVDPDLTCLAKIVSGGLPGGALAGTDEAMATLEFGHDAKVSHHGCHNAHPLSAAAGVTTLGLAADGAAQSAAASVAATLRDELNGVLARHGAAGVVHGTSSTFCLLLGVEEPIDQLPAETIKRGVTGPLSTALHCGMLLQGVHLFHGAAFVSTAHGGDDVERTVTAFDAVVPELQTEGLL
jgi:glutamate-1-semialdehyde 2,1-aminomutase